MSTFEDMSDEDFEKLEGPDLSSEDVTASAEEPQVEDTAEEEPVEKPDFQNPEDVDTPVGDGTLEDALSTEDEPVAEDTAKEDPKPEAVATGDDTTPPHTEAEPNTDEEAPTGAADEEEADTGSTEAPDYEAAYNEIMKPFKANGRTFTPKDPHEVMRLMQMGAGYTKKMQELQPSMKVLKMLENNGLADPDKLAHLIDVSKGNPEAISKLLKDGAIDPMDLDTTSETAYKPGDHVISDEEMNFHTVLEEAQADEQGKEVITHINGNWDTASKRKLYQEPELLQTLVSQKQSGIYDAIVTEMDRQQTLGKLGNAPFLDAYKAVGDVLHASGAFTPEALGQTSAPAAQSAAPTPALETRPAKAKSPVSNGDRAKAAGPTGSSRTHVPAELDVFAMSDAQMEAMETPPKNLG